MNESNRKKIRWPGYLWRIASPLNLERRQTLRVVRPDGGDLFAGRFRPGDYDRLWDAMWTASRCTFLISTANPEALSRFVLARASRRDFGWTDRDRGLSSPGDLVSFDTLYYRNQCGYAKRGSDWACNHPRRPDMGQDGSCHEYECPIAYNVSDRRTLKRIGVADDYEYDDEGFTEDATSWMELHSRPRHDAACNVWLGFKAESQEEFEAGARTFRALRWRLGPYVTLFAEATAPVLTTFAYYGCSESTSTWSPENYHDFGDGGGDLFVPYLDLIAEQGKPRFLPSLTSRPVAAEVTT
jgi:hypothetical protein